MKSNISGDIIYRRRVRYQIKIIQQGIDVFAKLYKIKIHPLLFLNKNQNDKRRWTFSILSVRPDDNMAIIYLFWLAVIYGLDKFFFTIFITVWIWRKYKREGRKRKNRQFLIKNSYNTHFLMWSMQIRRSFTVVFLDQF